MTVVAKLVHHEPGRNRTNYFRYFSKSYPLHRPFRSLGLSFYASLAVVPAATAAPIGPTIVSADRNIFSTVGL